MGKAEELGAAFGFLKPGEIALIKKIAHNLPKNAVFVNIGAGVGTSSLAVVEERTDLAGSCYTVDISAGGPLGGLQNEVNAFNEAGILGLLPNQFLGDSAEAAAQWGDKEIDFLFIDDGHLEPDVRRDIDSWLPHLKDGGIVAFHDYDSFHWPAVKLVVDELITKTQYPTIGRADTIIALKKVTKKQEQPAMKPSPRKMVEDVDTVGMKTRRARKAK